MATTTSTCPRCGGQIMADPERSWCLQCGGSPTDPLARKHWRQANKPAMLADRDVLPWPEFEAKWKIHRCQYARLFRGKVKVAPGVETSPTRKNGPRKPLTKERRPPRPPQQNELPPFPAFDSSWGQAVQERWLDIYLKLRLDSPGKEAKDALLNKGV